MRRSNAVIVWLVIFAVLAAIAHVMHSPTRTPGAPVTRSARVIGGDSLVMAGVRIRLHGIDVPEREQSCRDAQGRSYACGRDLGETMVRAGHAVRYGRGRRYVDAEREAREARRGLWAGEFDQPATWRQRNATR